MPSNRNAVSRLEGERWLKLAEFSRNVAKRMAKKPNGSDRNNEPQRA